jgi:N6-L-threonylcarbamoyladenine synthase
VLAKKTIKAALKYKSKTVMLAGGVSANQRLREKLAAAVKTELPQAIFQMPEFKYTTDNAAMVAALGAYLFEKKQFTPWNNIKADCNLGL